MFGNLYYVLLSYIVFGLCVLVGIPLIIYGLIPSAPFNCNSDVEQKELDICNKNEMRKSDCSTEQKELDDKKAKCLTKTSVFFPFGVIGICILLFGIVSLLFPMPSRKSRNNQIIDKGVGMIGSIFSTR